MSDLVLTARSVADDLGFVALSDLSTVLSELGVVESRLIGGHMVTLHVYRWGFGAEMFRESRDADLGIPPMVARDPRIVEILEARGYKREAGNRFIRKLLDVPVALKGLGEDRESDRLEAAIDILIPAYTSRPKDNVRLGNHLTTTEVPGLADALRRPGIPVNLRMRRLNGEKLSASIALPDEASAVILKALAWSKRGFPRDAIDLWRALEVASAARVEAAAFADGAGPAAERAVRQAFLGHAIGLQQIAKDRSLSRDGIRTIGVRIQALIQRVF